MMIYCGLTVLFVGFACDGMFKHGELYANTTLISLHSSRTSRIWRGLLSRRLVDLLSPWMTVSL